MALRTLVEDMRDLLERSLGPMIDVALDIPERLPAVTVDPHQLELAILNLAVNARDAMNGRGRLVISATRDDLAEGQVSGVPAGQYVSLSVEDNGSGMSADVLGRCLEPFFSTKGVGKGTGLGLSMVQGLAAQSGGGIGIDSTPGNGTRVTIWLPLSHTRAEDEEAAPVDEPQAPRPTHVLLVDDEEMVRHTTALQLRDLGYRVTEADSASTALRLLDDGLEPDILVTDHLMPAVPAHSWWKTCASVPLRCRCWSSPATRTSPLRRWRASRYWPSPSAARNWPSAWRNWSERKVTPRRGAG